MLLRVHSEKSKKRKELRFQQDKYEAAASKRDSNRIIGIQKN